MRNGLAVRRRTRAARMSESAFPVPKKWNPSELEDGGARGRGGYVLSELRLAGSHDGYLRPDAETEARGLDPEVAGRLFGHAGAAEGALSRLRVYRNIPNVPFATDQRGIDG